MHIIIWCTKEVMFTTILTMKSLINFKVMILDKHDNAINTTWKSIGNMRNW